MTRHPAHSVAWPVALFALVLAVLIAVPSVATAQEAKPTIAVTAVDLNQQTVTITNYGDSEVDPNGLILCNFPAYAPIEGAPVLAPGESAVVDASALAIDPATGEMGIYTVPEYENPDAIITYVEWGETGHQRAVVAIEAAVWSDGTAEVTGGVITASSTNPTSPGDWAAAAQDQGEGGGEATELAQTGAATDLLVVVGAALLVGGVTLASGRRRVA